MAPKKKQQSDGGTAHTARGRKRSSGPSPLPSMEHMLAGISSMLGGSGSDASSPERQAQELMYDAWETSDEARRQALAHEALTLWPDCADAYVLLAGEEVDLEAKRALYEKGVAAGERALGPDTFEEDAGDFWSLLNTRPYMRARQGLAGCLWALGRREEAVGHYQELLRLNPNDNQGVRFVLAGHLVELGQDEALARLLQAYEEDGTTSWAYTRALLAFRQGGANPTAHELLTKARKQNPHVPGFLLRHKRMPRTLPEFFSFGDESEAITYVVEGRAAWESSAGALDWLATECGAPRGGAPRATVVAGVDVRRLLTREGEHLSESAQKKVLQLGEAAVPALVDVLEDEDLLPTDSPGKGWAPIHAARLLGSLRAEAAIPAMVEVLGTLEPDIILFSELIQALVRIGPTVAPAVLQALEGGQLEGALGLLEVLSRCGARSEAILTRLSQQLREKPLLGAIFLTDYGDPAALPLLQAAFDDYTPEASGDLLFGETLIELGNAIQELGGELSDGQRKKLDAVKDIRGRMFGGPPTPEPARRRERPGRNAPCWCGSGQKYKTCHLAQDEGRSPRKGP